MPNVSMVIPVFRSQESIGLVVERLNEVLPRLFDQYEAILVDDGSPDASWQAVQACAAKYPWVRGFQLMRNFGQHNALLCGIRQARYELLVTMDDDLQHPPEALSTLLEALGEQYDVVYGSPVQERHGLLRDLASQVTKWVLQTAMGAETARNISAYRLFRTQIRQAFMDYRAPYVNLDVLLTWGTKRFTRVTVPHAKRTIGQSNYTVGKLITHTLNMLTGFSTLPLQIASYLGLAMAAFGALLLFYILVVRLLIFGDYEVPGFTFLASVVSIFAGAQMFTLGIIGEYLARMHFRLMDKPSFVLRQTTDETPLV